MKEFPCPVCDSTDFAVEYPDTIGALDASFDYNFARNFNLTYRIIKCRDCGHHYASPRPESLWSRYSGDDSDSIYMENSDQRIATSHEALKRIIGYKEKGRLLDVGCATGDFLTVAKTFYKVEGLELSEWSSKLAQKKGFSVHRQLLSEMKIRNHYDIVTLWGVIEHFEYPKKEIENISGLLKDGGLVCLWTGDVSSVVAKVLGKKWWYYQGQHIQMFTQKSICRLFESSGFKKVYIGPYPYVVTSRSLINSLSRYPSIRKIAEPILKMKIISSLKFTLKLPGEMFAIFEKSPPIR